MLKRLNSFPTGGNEARKSAHHSVSARKPSKCKEIRGDNNRNTAQKEEIKIFFIEKSSGIYKIFLHVLLWLQRPFNGERIVWSINNFGNTGLPDAKKKKKK